MPDDALARLDRLNEARHAPDGGAVPGLRTLLSIEAWADRRIPPPDRLLGDLVTTTTRMFLVGRTGLGKTMFGFAMACGMANGEGFLHWRSERPARVLYMDGEMAGELIKARSIDALRRVKLPPPSGNLMIYSTEIEDDIALTAPMLGRLPPLNTEPGKQFTLALIDALGGVDVVVFDNVMSLVVGDQKDEVPWSDTLPLVASLTTRQIGQVWLDHTGHNTDRQYGSATKAWRFDTVGLMTPLSDNERGRHELAFGLSFEHPGKARRRSPDNWADFETCTIRLSEDRWSSTIAGAARRHARLSPKGEQFRRALLDALAHGATAGRTTRTAWYAECARVGLAEQTEATDSAAAKRSKMAAFRKYLIELKAAGLIGVDGEVVTYLAMQAHP